MASEYHIAEDGKPTRKVEMGDVVRFLNEQGITASDGNSIGAALQILAHTGTLKVGGASIYFFP